MSINTVIESKRYPLATARRLAEKFVDHLTPQCETIEIVGSIRRQRSTVKDIELLIVPRMLVIKDRGDLFGRTTKANAASLALDVLVESGKLVRRPNKDGHLCWGPENKLATHEPTGMPVDFFFTIPAAWWNALVVRTGPVESNKAIALAALKMGWNWHAYGDGFSRTFCGKFQKHRVESERDCFEFVGLPYREPHLR